MIKDTFSLYKKKFRDISALLALYCLIISLCFILIYVAPVSLILLIPFIIVPIVALVVTWMAMYIGFLSPMGAIQVPWTTPPIIAGLLLDGWQGAVIQIINLVLSTIIYLPFIKGMDKSMLAEEAEMENAEN